MNISFETIQRARNPFALGLATLLCLAVVAATPAVAQSIDELKAENADLRQKVEQLTRERDQLTRQIEVLRDELNESQAQRAQLQQQTQSLQLQTAELVVKQKQAQQQRIKTYIRRGTTDQGDMVATQYLPLDMMRGSRGEHQLSFEAVVNKPDTVPATIKVRLASAFTGNNFRGTKQMTFNADGTTMTAVVIDYERDSRRTLGRKKVDISDEYVMAEMSYDNLQTIAAAGKVTIDIGPVEAAFPLEMIEACRALADELE